MQIYEFLSKSQPGTNAFPNWEDVCLYANIQIFNQITTNYTLSFLVNLRVLLPVKGTYI